MKNFKEIREKYRSKFPPSLVAAAVKIALDMGGAMTPAVKKIEAMKRGLSNDPIVKDALRAANESVNEGKDFPTSMTYFDKKGATKAEKIAKGLKIYKNTKEISGKAFTVFVSGPFDKVEKWLDLI